MLPVAICFSREDAAYMSGETLWGEIRFSLNGPVKVRGIYITIKGKGKVHVGKDKHEQVFIHKFAPLWKPDDEPYVQDGFQLPWAFHLPDSLPSSFHGKQAQVSYFVEVTVDRIRALDWHEKKEFIVMERHRLDGYPSSQNEIAQKLVEKVGIGFHRRPVDISMHLPSHALVTRQRIPITIRIRNHSMRDIDHIVLRLIQIYTLMLNNQKKQYVHTVFKKDGGKVVAGRDMVWDDKELILPGLACTGGCWPYIQVEYILKFATQFGFSGPELTLESPVVVGTSFKDANEETKESTHLLEDQNIISENVIYLNDVMIDAKECQNAAAEVQNASSPCYRSDILRNRSKGSLNSAGSSRNDQSHISNESSINDDLVETLCPYCEQTFIASPTTLSEINNRLRCNLGMSAQSMATASQEKDAIPLVVDIDSRTSRSVCSAKRLSRTLPKRKAPPPPKPKIVSDGLVSAGATSLNSPTPKKPLEYLDLSAASLGCRRKEKEYQSFQLPAVNSFDSSTSSSTCPRRFNLTESHSTETHAVKMKINSGTTSTKEKVSLISASSTNNSNRLECSPPIVSSSMQLSPLISKSENSSNLIYTTPCNTEGLSRSSSLPRTFSRPPSNISTPRMWPNISESSSYPDLSESDTPRPRSPPPPYTAEPEMHSYSRNDTSPTMHEHSLLLRPSPSDEQQTYPAPSQSENLYENTRNQQDPSELNISSDDVGPLTTFPSSQNRNPFRR